MRVVKLAFVVVLAWTVCLTSMALASTPGGPVGQVAATYTPSIHWTGTTQQVRKMVQCGANMYAVGSFTQIDQGGVTTTRNGAFSFSATTGKLTAWNPNVNGTVNGVALSTDCSTAYLGGSFTTVGPSAAVDIVAVDTATGAIRSAFAHSANNKVETLVMVAGHLIVGGYFTSINGGTQKYLTSLNPTTGASDGYVTLPISGMYVYKDQNGPVRCRRHLRVQHVAQPERRTPAGVGHVHVDRRAAPSTGRHAGPWYRGNRGQLVLPGVQRLLLHQRALLRARRGMVA